LYNYDWVAAELRAQERAGRLDKQAKEAADKWKVTVGTMNDKDPVMVDLDRYLTELEEDYVDPADAARERAEYLADQED
jgi:hypothetical protein